MSISIDSLTGSADLSYRPPIYYQSVGRFFFFQAEDGIRDYKVTGVQTCALPILTTLTLHLGRALGREWRSGDVVVVTELDHHANSDTWSALAKERGLEVRTIRMQIGRASCRERV